MAPFLDILVRIDCLGVSSFVVNFKLILNEFFSESILKTLGHNTKYVPC